MEKQKITIFSSSTNVLILSNLVTMAVAVYQKWPIGDIMWIFWLQSIIIGIFQAKKMLNLKKFSTSGMTYNGEPVENNKRGKRKIVRFFLMHYGIFHLGYYAFLSAKFEFPVISALIFSLVFIANHLFSYLFHKKEDQNKVRNIGHLMFFPYFRIIPMHLAVGIASLAGALPLIIFLALKTVADVGMHVIEHRI